MWHIKVIIISGTEYVGFSFTCFPRERFSSISISGWRNDKCRYFMCPKTTRWYNVTKIYYFLCVPGTLITASPRIYEGPIPCSHSWTTPNSKAATSFHFLNGIFMQQQYWSGRGEFYPISTRKRLDDTILPHVIASLTEMLMFHLSQLYSVLNVYEMSYYQYKDCHHKDNIDTLSYCDNDNFYTWKVGLDIKIVFDILQQIMNSTASLFTSVHFSNVICMQPHSPGGYAFAT